MHLRYFRALNRQGRSRRTAHILVIEIIALWPERSIAQRCARCTHQPVLLHLDIGIAAISGQVAIGIIAEACSTRRGILVEAVGGVGAVHIIFSIRPSA